MPIFEYLCDGCGARFEQLVRKPAEDSVRCPSCGELRVTQQISTFLAPVPGKFKAPTRPHKEYPDGLIAHHDD